jgi:3',5'-cyclic AMP phosphodiesterase CpdA
VALVGLSSAVPTPPFHASGRLGEAQLARAEELLREAGGRGLFRTVLVHHPPVPGITSARRRLTDCAAFRGTVTAAGAELVLHGHMHRWTRNHLETGERALPVLGVPSASSHQPDADHRAGYSLYDIAATDQGFSVTVTERQVDEAFKAFTTRSQRSFLVPSPQA